MPNPSRHRKLYEVVVEELGLQIVRGRYRPGDALPNEDALCRELAVSRGVLREATKVLAQKGLIRARTKTGTQVQPRGHWNLFDPDLLVWTLEVEHRFDFLRQVTEVRCVLESEAVRLAAECADDAQVAVMRRRYERMAAALADASTYDYDTYLQRDMAFHNAIFDACHNELLACIGHTMRTAVQTARQLDIRDIEIQRQSLVFHLELLTAIEGRQPREAHAAARMMFNHVRQHIPSD